MYTILNENLSLLIKALGITIQLTATSLVFGVIIGLIIAFLKISHIKIFNSIANLYLTVIRGMPLIVLIALFYFGIYKIITLSPFWAGVIALGIHNGAYIGEIFRGSIQSIDRGQMEASRSLGMTYLLAMRRIILPQAFKRAIPPLGNQFIIGLKDSSLVFFIGVTELWGTGQSIASRIFMQLPTYLVVAIFYLAMVLFFSWIVSILEAKLDVDKRG
ncbi:MAG: amino acid ABC transporter permease [Tepidibacillus sp.]|uniref:amino acid ABC transporter permease n=1 Tax=Tepidibacillus sp. HK-1 TaxID=1883407 RepID=UPI000853090C|nr:amino acid ABC transporter permease [Tepidibacillus sp. HK-1]